VIIESWSELRDNKIRDTKNRQGADDAVNGISRRNGDRIWCGRGRHRAARIRALLDRGCEDGHDVDDWLNAERELRHASSSSAA